MKYSTRFFCLAFVCLTQVQPLLAQTTQASDALEVNEVNLKKWDALFKPGLYAIEEVKTDADGTLIAGSAKKSEYCFTSDALAMLSRSPAMVSTFGACDKLTYSLISNKFVSRSASCKTADGGKTPPLLVGVTLSADAREIISVTSPLGSDDKPDPKQQQSMMRATYKSACSK